MRIKFFQILYLLSFVFCYSRGISQPVKQWDKVLGGDTTDTFSCIEQTADGGYILAGYSQSGISGDKTKANWDVTKATGDYWIVKTDANGNKVWDQTFGGDKTDQLFAIQQTSDGGYICGGRSNSGATGDKSQANIGGLDYWVVKMDATGSKQWDKRFGGSGTEYLSSIHQTSDGGYILGGYSDSNAGGDKSQGNQGLQDYWVVKIDGSGTKQWDKTFGGLSADLLKTVKQVSDGGYILGGESFSGVSGSKTQPSQGFYDYWMVKINATGTKLWDKRFGGSGYEYFSSLKQTSDKGFIPAGISDSDVSGDKTQPNRGLFGYDYWIVKTDSNGIKQWDKAYGGNDNDELWNIQQTLDGGYLVSGESYSPISGEKTENNFNLLASPEQAWLVKTDTNGIVQWDKTVFSMGHDENARAIQTTEGCYVVAQQSYAIADGDKTFPSKGHYDFWITKLCIDNTLNCNTSANPLSCNGFNDGSATANHTGGTSPYTYLWNPGGATTKTITRLAAGTYTVIITDALSTTATATVTITEPAALTIALTSASLACNGNNSGTATASPSGGTSPYFYIWNNGGMTSTINLLPSSIYTVTVTDSNGCTTIDSITVNQPPAISLTVTSTNTNCNQSDGSATAAASGGTGTFIYLWSNGKNTSTITGLASGTYTIIVTDDNSCSMASSVVITDLNGVNVQIVSSVSVACYGFCNGSATAFGSGGTMPHIYSWNNGQTNPTASNLCAGNYSVTVTDNAGCTSMAAIDISEPIALSISVTTVSVTCYGKNNGAATVSVSGGTSPYIYTWSNVGANAVVTGLTAGTYTVLVSDKNGCSVQQPVTVNEPPLLSVSVTSTFSCKANEASASAVASGGTSPYNYTWSNGIASPTVTGLGTGTYTVTITDTNNCTATNTINAISGTTLVVTASTDRSIVLGASTTLSVTGGGSYLWSPATGLDCVNCPNPVATPVATTYYCVTVTDANNCTDSACVTVSIYCDLYIPTAFSPDADGQNEIECAYSAVCYSPMNFVIFNRWGEIVFHTADSKVCWDGRYNGKPMDTGVFYYLFEGTDTNGKSIFKKGTLNLIW